MPLCPYCHTVVSEDTRFCPVCRRPLAVTKSQRRYSMSGRGYRIGFVIVLILALVGLVALVSLSVQLNTANNALATVNDQLSASEDSLATKTAELTSTEGQLESTQSQLAEKEKELALYKDTYGSVVESSVQPPFQGADIVSNEAATNPTWAQLLDFLLRDTTDQNVYFPGIYMCGDFARDMYNHAELLGIRAAYVAIELPSGYHALNAFKTTDRGLVFVDCTGLELGEAGPSNRDKIVNVKLGRDYIPRSLFPESGWSSTWEDMGTVLDVQIYW
jgi:hypothetical protein